MLYQFLVINIDMGVDTTMVEVVGVVTLILGIMIVIYILPQNKKNDVNSQNNLVRLTIINVGRKVISHIPIILPNIWLTFIKSLLKEMGNKLRPTLLVVKAKWIVIRFTYFEVSDFFEDLSGKINHLISYDNV